MEKLSQSEAKQRISSILDIIQKTPEYARDYFSFALDYHKDDSSCLFALGLMELTGTGGEKNVPDGVSHLMQSADAGEIDAFFILGSAYFWGDDVEQDYAKAFPLLLKAAELGHFEACNYVAECYKDGKGVEIDMSKSLEWLSVYIDKDLEMDDSYIVDQDLAAVSLLKANGLNPDEYSSRRGFKLKDYSGKGTAASDPFIIKGTNNAKSYENFLIEYLSAEWGHGYTSYEILDYEIHWDGNTAIDYVHFRVDEEPLEEDAESIPLYEKTLFFDVTERFILKNESLGIVIPKCQMVYHEDALSVTMSF